MLTRVGSGAYNYIITQQPLLGYYVIVRVKMCDDGSPCCSCVTVSTSSVPEVPCSQVDVLDNTESHLHTS